MAAVLIFDADNTLWNTDGVFRAAQVALLTTLANAGHVPDPATQVEMLRVLDRELVEQMGVAEYDFRLLAGAVTRFYINKLTVEEAVGRSLASKATDVDLENLIDSAHGAFTSALTEVPALFPETLPVITTIRAAINRGVPLATVLYSEGDEVRLERILEAHQFRARPMFDEIFLAPKTTEGFEKAWNLGRTHLTTDNQSVDGVVVGDSLKRDVALANRAAYITVYKPSTFKGVEVPRNPEEKPRFTISALSEFPHVLSELGYAVCDIS